MNVKWVFFLKDKKIGIYILLRPKDCRETNKLNLYNTHLELIMNAKLPEERGNFKNYFLYRHKLLHGKIKKLNLSSIKSSSTSPDILTSYYLT